MKIIIASTIVPFINGGGTFIVDWLEQKLKEYGHEAQAIRIPYSSNYNWLLTQDLGLRMYHLEDACDRLITIRMPAYLIKHPNKYLWFIHHYREFYDLWDTEYNAMPDNARTYSIREYVKRSDELAFKEAKKIYTNSKVVSDRLDRYNHVDSEVVYPPLLCDEQFFCEEYGEYIYYSSRICGHKRQLLAIEAMKYTKTPIKLVITGKTENDLIAKEIRKIISENDLYKKVIVEDRWIEENEKVAYLSKCLAAIYIPYDEDSYGYPSLEAHHSEKAVISCSDSGGTSELIVNGYNGYITEPDPMQLAEIFDHLYENRKLAEQMGRNGKERLNELNISWDYVIRRFTE